MRKVVCELINQPGKINWRACERSEKELERAKGEVGEVMRECHLLAGY